MTLVYRSADLDVAPKVMELANTTHSSMGDAHGNTLKIIYTLMEEGILEFSPDDYRALRDIFKTPINLPTNSKLSTEEHFAFVREQLIKFEEIIKRAKVNPVIAHTIIGDELCDRGTNDYFTLKLLDMLYKKGANIDILLSNHGVEFLIDYERDIFVGYSKLGWGQSESLVNMVFLIRNKIVDEQEIRDMVKLSYLPMLKAINYTLSPEGELTVFTHAPVGLETIKAIAELFNIPYKDQSIKGLITTIDNINVHLQANIGKNKLATSITNIGYSNSAPIPLSNPLFRLTWNRVLGEELVTKPAGNFKVKFVHGHVGPESLNLPSHENLDNLFGKSPLNSKTDKDTKQFTRRSSDITAKQLAEDPSLLTKITKNVYKLESFKYLMELQTTTTRLIGESEKYFNYEEVGKAANTLISALESAHKAFFAAENLKPSDFIKFDETVKDAIAKATPEFKNHRAWFQTLSPILKRILGVLALIPFCIPALIVSYKSRTGFIDTFFGTPDTNAFVSLQAYKANMDNFIKNNLEDEFNDPNQSLDI
ncbi:MAG: hypothetical protein H0U73_06330 [Tatlockia sp.]|nr:hypothetical protein [Tatlockia sp.]